MTSERTLLINALRLLRRQGREIEQLKHAFLSLWLVLADHYPELVSEMQAKLPEVIALEKAELPQETENDAIWNAWLELRENETVTGRDVIVH